MRLTILMDLKQHLESADLISIQMEVETTLSFSDQSFTNRSLCSQGNIFGLFAL
jgi:hypothetical protein